MLDWLTSGLLATWLNLAPTETLLVSNLAGWVEVHQPDFNQVEMKPDPAIEAIVAQHLRQWANLGLPETLHGVWIQAGNQVVAEHQGFAPLPAASLTKIATTLVALDEWGADYQFETVISASGPVQDGVLQGDLVVQGSGDPFFVWEEAIALGNALNQAGIRQVTGNLVIVGNFAMNFETAPIAAGNLLRQGLDSARWSAEVATQYATLPPSTPRPQVTIAGSVTALSVAEAAQTPTVPLLSHQSLPLADILKAMNSYSNNIMSEMLAQVLGGGATLATRAAELAQVPAAEIQLINGSGLGTANQISSHGVTAMLTAIQTALKSSQRNVADVFPVIGRDRGTLSGRSIPTAAAVKTGTLAEVSSLAGVIPTRDRGLVWFSIINLGAADLTTLHNLQDSLLQDIVQTWGDATAIPADLTPNDHAAAGHILLGNPDRNQPR